MGEQTMTQKQGYLGFRTLRSVSDLFSSETIHTCSVCDGSGGQIWYLKDHEKYLLDTREELEAELQKTIALIGTDIPVVFNSRYKGIISAGEIVVRVVGACESSVFDLHAVGFLVHPPLPGLIYGQDERAEGIGFNPDRVWLTSHLVSSSPGPYFNWAETGKDTFWLEPEVIKWLNTQRKMK